MLLVVTIVTACNNRTDKFITGTFVHEGQSDYSIAYDTLNIQTLVQDQTYQVSLRTGFHRIRNKKLLPKEFKVKTWQATWNEKDRTLSESYGRQLILLPGNQTIQLKASKFTRL